MNTPDFLRAGEASADARQTAAEAADEHYQDVLTQIEELKVYQLQQRLPRRLEERLALILEQYADLLIREGDEA